MQAVRHRDLFGKDYAKRHELIALRTGRMSYKSIADFFNTKYSLSLDHSTIIYNLRRFAPALVGSTGYRPTSWMRGAKKSTRDWVELLEEEVSLMLPYLDQLERYVESIKPAPTVPRPMKYGNLIEEECVRVNEGHNYGEYRRRSEKKKMTPERRAFLERIRKEHAARVKERGHLIDPETRKKLFAEYSNKPIMRPRQKGYFR